MYLFVFVLFLVKKAYTVHWCDEDAHLVNIRLPESFVLSMALP
jgi:hypothetical protein